MGLCWDICSYGFYQSFTYFSFVVQIRNKVGLNLPGLVSLTGERERTWVGTQTERDRKERSHWRVCNCRSRSKMGDIEEEIKTIMAIMVSENIRRKIEVWRDEVKDQADTTLRKHFKEKMSRTCWTVTKKKNSSKDQKILNFPTLDSRGSEEQAQPQWCPGERRREEEEGST